jgi:hypothetical protein
MLTRLTLRKILPKSAPRPEGLGGPDRSLDTHDVLVRSESNVLRWMQYLPADCVQQMIWMGWDEST